MKLISLLLGFCLALPCFSCTDEAKERLKVLARVIEKKRLRIGVGSFQVNEILEKV